MRQSRTQEQRLLREPCAVVSGQNVYSCMDPLPWPMLRAEAIEHASELLIYVPALSWTRTFLPLLGGPVLITWPALMFVKFHGPYLSFVWLYVLSITGICSWWFRFADDTAKSIETSSSPAGPAHLRMLLGACFNNSSKSMAW